MAGTSKQKLLRLLAVLFSALAFIAVLYVKTRSAEQAAVAETENSPAGKASTAPTPATTYLGSSKSGAVVVPDRAHWEALMRQLTPSPTAPKNPACTTTTDSNGATIYTCRGGN